MCERWPLTSRIKSEAHGRRVRACTEHHPYTATKIILNYELHCYFCWLRIIVDLSCIVMDKNCFSKMKFLTVYSFGRNSPATSSICQNFCGKASCCKHLHLQNRQTEIEICANAKSKAKQKEVHRKCEKGTLKMKYGRATNYNKQSWAMGIRDNCCVHCCNCFKAKKLSRVTLYY